MPAFDDYTGREPTFAAVAAAAVTPSDANDLTNVTRALWVGTAGSVQVTMRAGQTVTFSNMNVGWHPIRVRRVWATGTTATNIVAVW